MASDRGLMLPSQARSAHDPPSTRRVRVICGPSGLANGQSGVAAIAELRGAFGASIPAFLITDDTSPERLHEAKESGYHLLHKPVRPMRLRAMLSQLLKSDPLAGASA
jgi:CheY-like chemotaxis protein